MSPVSIEAYELYPSPALSVRPTPGRRFHEPETTPQTDPGFLVANSLFWLPWGLINLVKPKSWSGEVIPGIEVYDLSSPVARTEVRAMYGGLQMAIGPPRSLGATRDKHRDSALGFFVLALSGLSLCRLGGHGRRRRVLLPVVQHEDHSGQIQPGWLGHVRAAQHDLRLDSLLLLRPHQVSSSTQRP